MCFLAVAMEQGSQAAIVENMQINMAVVNYYNGQGSPKYFQIQTAFALQDVIAVENLPITTTTGTNSHELDGTFQMTKAELVQDLSSGAAIGARAEFHGGQIVANNLVRSTFQLNGNLYEVQRDVSGNKTGENLISSGLLLEAEMTVDTFILKEEQIINRVVSGDDNGLQVFFTPINGSMADGSSGITIGDFRADYFLTNSVTAFLNGPVVDFDTQQYNVLGPVSIQIEAIPEPATLALLGIGGMLYARKRKAS
jgi:hypothetical protein